MIARMPCEPAKQRENARKAPVTVEQLGRVAIAGKGRTLRQVQMHATIERPAGIIELAAHALGRRSMLRPAAREIVPGRECLRSVRGVGQHRGAGQQAMRESAQDAVGHGPIQAKIIGMQNDCQAHASSPNIARETSRATKNLCHGPDGRETGLDIDELLSLDHVKTAARA